MVKRRRAQVLTVREEGTDDKEQSHAGDGKCCQPVKTLLFCEEKVKVRWRK